MKQRLRGPARQCNCCLASLLVLATLVLLACCPPLWIGLWNLADTTLPSELFAISPQGQVRWQRYVCTQEGSLVCHPDGSVSVDRGAGYVTFDAKGRKIKTPASLNGVFAAPAALAAGAEPVWAERFPAANPAAGWQLASSAGQAAAVQNGRKLWTYRLPQGQQLSGALFMANGNTLLETALGERAAAWIALDRQGRELGRCDPSSSPATRAAKRELGSKFMLKSYLDVVAVCADGGFLCYDGISNQLLMFTPDCHERWGLRLLCSGYGNSVPPAIRIAPDGAVYFLDNMHVRTDGDY